MKVRIFLTEGETYCMSRNNQADHILENLILVPIMSSTEPSIFSLPRYHDAVWFFGDLNYRFRGQKKNWALSSGYSLPTIPFLSKPSLPKRIEVLEWIRDNNIPSLMGRDELSHLRAFKFSSLGNFEEGF